MRSACEHRLEMAEKVFSNEIMDVPQSLAKTSVSEFHGKKSEITKRFIESSLSCLPIAANPMKTAIIVEMSPIIRAKCLSLSSSLSTMSDLAVLLYYHVQSICFGATRIDLVFDRYFEKSLKEDMRLSRGIGSRVIFNANSPIPLKMDDFLMHSQNKNDFNEFLAKEFIHLHHGEKLLVVTYRDGIITNNPSELLDGSTSIAICQSEEADQRLVRHTLHCLADHRYERVVVRTIDTDVLMIVIQFVSPVRIHPSTDGFVQLVNSSLYYDVKKIIDSLGPEICGALLFFYAFTGCDIVSSFYGKGKCKAWDTWMKSTNKMVYTTTFTKLGDEPSAITEDDIDVLEMFVIELYSPAQQKVFHKSLTIMRLDSFKSSADDDLRKLPPSRSALREHSKRASYQSGFLWKEALSNINIPDVSAWGWQFDNGKQIYLPKWQSDISTVSIENFTITCKCYKQKCKSCKCKKIQCISMCGCKRKCCHL